MTTIDRSAAPTAAVLRHAAAAADHVAGICFKTGPPRRIGVELEWTVHSADRPQRPLEKDLLRTALGPYAPQSLGNARPVPLPGGGTLTVEPGGQLEISSDPAASLTEVHTAVTTARHYLRDLLARAGLVLGDSGLDAHREPRRLLDTPRYAAMQRMFDTRGRHGHTMMCSTAGLQICLDAGTVDELTARWAALHEIGPALLATFATSRRHAGRDTGWACGRMAVWYGMDPHRTRAVATTGDPATRWAEYALAAPLLCVRQAGERWDAPPGVSFADWIAGALPRPPTVDDLDYHLSTLFPPVRPRGYLEIRYLDAQPGGEWIAPAAVIAALVADEDGIDAARAAAAPAAGRWTSAARAGLTDPRVASAATALMDLARRRLDRTGLPPTVRDTVTDIVDRRLHGTDGAPRKDEHR